MTPAEFVSKYQKDAERIQRQTGLDAWFTLAHAALESGYGEHAPGFNFFGIKAGKSWTGGRQLLRTWEATKDGKLNLQPGAYTIRIYKPGEAGNPFGKNYYAHRIMDYFRSYPSAGDSFQDHADLLQKPRYVQAWANRQDPIKCADEMMKAGYGTDPAYIAKFKTVLARLQGRPVPPSNSNTADNAKDEGSGHGWLWFLFGTVIATGAGYGIYRYKMRKPKKELI